MHDLIIVGAGTAGCVLADKLSASGRTRVLLIEAGGQPSKPFVKMPAGFAKLFRSKVDWAFESEPQTELNGRRVFTPRGRMLGGSSNMNAQIHQWCHPADFDGWVADGAAGWSWREVAPVFRDLERWHGDGGDTQQRGSSGPMEVCPNRNTHELSRRFVAAARAAGLTGDGQQDYNGTAYTDGAWMCQLAHRDGRRFSAYDAFLVPAMRRSNLEVLTGARVTRICFDQGRASGVAVQLPGGSERILQAARGVVLAAGAFGSPQLLLLSGIGDPEALRALGIQTVVDSPEVGANLQDHSAAPVITRSRGTSTLRSAETPGQLFQYFVMRRGMLASNAVEAFAFARVPPQTGDGPPNLELLFAPFEWRNQGLEPPKIDAFSAAVMVIAPKSRGRLWLKSPDPLAAPAIDLGLFNDRDGEDAAVLLAGIRLMRRIVAAAPLAEFADGEMFPGATPGEDDRDLLSRAYSEAQTIYHPSSTCRMGSDARAVADPQLRVRGVDGLWVADASAMPSVPRGHPNAVVAMLAARAAEWISA